MNIVTTRFGPIDAREPDLIQVPEGLVGFRGTTQYVLWPDAEAGRLVWLQSTAEPDLAFAMIEPRLAVADYRVDLRPGDRAALELDEAGEPLVYVILNRGDQGLTVNLQGPLVFNLARPARPAARLDLQPPCRPVPAGRTGGADPAARPLGAPRHGLSRRAPPTALPAVRGPAEPCPGPVVVRR